jgi:hypothetical protein
VLNNYRDVDKGIKDENIVFMKYTGLKHELRTLSKEDLGAEIQNVIASEDNADSAQQDVARLMADYPGVDTIPFTVVTFAESKINLGRSAADILLDGSLMVSLALTGETMPTTLKDELRGLDCDEVARATENVLTRQSDYSEAWDIVDALTKEYPALELTGSMSKTHAERKYTTGLEANKYICGALVPALVLKQLIDQTELASIPTLSS